MMTITPIHLIPKAPSIFLTEHRTQYHWSPQSWTSLAKYVSHHLLMARTRKSKETFWMSLEVVLLYGKEIWCCASIFLRLKLKNYISSETDLRRDNICITFLNFYFFAKYLCKFHYKKNNFLLKGWWNYNSVFLWPLYNTLKVQEAKQTGEDIFGLHLFGTNCR